MDGQREGIELRDKGKRWEDKIYKYRTVKNNDSIGWSCVKFLTYALHF